MGRGTYALIFRIKRTLRKQIGKFGEFEFPQGIYVYIGSAMGSGATSLEHRIKRHFSKKKKLKWHIDYLLVDKEIEILGVIYAYSNKRLECEISRRLAQIPKFSVVVEKFGATDCVSGCPAHLYKVNTNSIEEVKEMIFNSFRSVDASPQWLDAKSEMTIEDL